MASNLILEMRSIEKRFGPSVALDDVSFAVHAGEVHALVGENGAGKSTLMKILSGALAPDSGHMTLGGTAYAPKGPRDARELGVAMIYQELSLAPDLTVEQNLTLGREPSHYGVVRSPDQRRTALEALAELEASDIAPDRSVATLSAAERQLVEIARAISHRARVLVMDEPTSSLSGPEAGRLFQVVRRLRDRGVAIIYISHFLEEVAALAERFTVLRDGRSVASGEVPADASRKAEFIGGLLEAMTGRRIDEAFPKVPHEPGPVVLEAAGVSGGRSPKEATLSLRRGEILGIAGLVGAGRSELLRTLFGLNRMSAGRVEIRPRDTATAIPRQRDPSTPPWVRLAQGMGLLSESRKEEGLAVAMSIEDNVTLSCLARSATYGILRTGARRAAVTQLLGRLGVRYRTPQQRVVDLSGGNQQKVALARLLHHDVDILLLDEPTRGVDVGSKAEIYRLIGELAASGKAIVFVSSYLPELLGVCDRIAVMHRGRLGPTRTAGEWTEGSLLGAATTGADSALPSSPSGLELLS